MLWLFKKYYTIFIIFLVSIIAPVVGHAAGEQAKMEQLEVQIKDLDKRIEYLESFVEDVRKGAYKIDNARIIKKPQSKKQKSLLDSVSICSIGCDFSDLSKAVKAVKDNGTVYLAAEENKTCAVIRKPVKIIGQISLSGKRSHLKGGVCQNKGPLVVESGGVLIENLEISDVNVSHNNGACIRIGPNAVNVTIRNVYCHDSQNGIMAKTKLGTLRIENSIFENNGFNNGQAHGLYLESGGEIILKNIKILSTKEAGQTIKITAPKMLIEDSVLLALNSRNSRTIDNFGGGILTIKNSILQQGPHSENHEMLGVALEKGRILKSKHKIILENNWFIFDNQKKGFFSTQNIGVLFRARKKGQYLVKNNKIVGMGRVNQDGVIMQNNDLFENRKDAGLPEYDGSLKSFPNGY